MIPLVPRPKFGKAALSQPVVAIFLASALLALAALFLATSPSHTGNVLIGGRFSLEAGDGKKITDADMRGHPFLVYFGYTHCPDICPSTLAQISDVLKLLPGQPIRALFVTVDPERDTPATMKDYVASFDPRIVGVSGSPSAIMKMLHAFRVYARKVPGKDGDYGMDHSSVVYLMDAGGKFVEAFNLERPPAEAARELARYF